MTAALWSVQKYWRSLLLLFVFGSWALACLQRFRLQPEAFVMVGGPPLFLASAVQSLAAACVLVHTGKFPHSRRCACQTDTSTKYRCAELLSCTRKWLINSELRLVQSHELHS